MLYLLWKLNTCRKFCAGQKVIKRSHGVTQLINIHEKSEKINKIQAFSHNNARQCYRKFFELVFIESTTISQYYTEKMKFVACFILFLQVIKDDKWHLRIWPIFILSRLLWWNISYYNNISCVWFNLLHSHGWNTQLQLFRTCNMLSCQIYIRSGQRSTS